MKRMAFVLSVMGLVFAVAVLAQIPNQPGPEQKKLDVWAGKWTIHGEAKDSPSGPTYKFDWTLEGNWLPGGFFLVVHGSFRSPDGEDRWLEVLGYDPVKKTHVGYVFDYNGTSFIYTSKFSDRSCFERGPHWRHEWNFVPDGMSVMGKGEREQDGKWWTEFEAKGVKTPAQTQVGSAEQELLNLMQDWMNAEVKADMAFLDRFIADDCVITDPVGAVWTKAQFLEGLKSGEGKVISFVLDNMKARVYGDAAVVTGRMTSKQTFKGQDISGQYQCTDMFIKKAGQWQCVAIHLSMIMQK